MKTLQISNSDKVALIDDEDLEKCLKYKWTLSAYGYVISYVAYNYIIRLHRLILNLPVKCHIIEPDHKDRNKLNNQKENLRPSTHRQNARNKSAQCNNKSGYKGVSWHKASRKWRACIEYDLKHIHLGTFHLKEDAAKAYNNKAKELFGEFAALNNI